MKYRKLRMAWSVGCGIACALLIVMWVRSYQTWDSPFGPILKRWELQLNSVRGYLLIGVRDSPPNATTNWRWRTFHADRFTNDEISGSIVWRFTSSAGALGFGAVQTALMWQVYMPYWFLSLIPIGGSLLGVRWFARYSLKALLIAMTLAAIVLGLAFYAARK
jgi:hypothetical protein